MTYKPIQKAGQIILGTGAPVIVTGWTVKEAVARKLDPTTYAAIGQLYSPARGISTLIRNLLANPQVRDLIILSATKEDRNSQSCFRLWDFFYWGFEQGQTDTGVECWVVKGTAPAFIDIEIPEFWLQTIRDSVTPHLYESLDTLVESAPLWPQSPIPWGQPQAFPPHEVLPTVLPGPRYGHRIEGRTIAETWVKIVHRIKTTGTIRPTGYDGNWQELIDLVAVVTDEPEQGYFPEPNYLPVDREAISNYIPQILADAPYQEGVKYTYGQRLRSWFGVDQIDQVVKKLAGEIDAASAVMNLWDVKDHEKGGSPCLNHIWLRVVDGELSLTATFRSNDMFSAWPSNAMGLRALQRHIFERVKGHGFRLTMGPLITISQSAHIYDDCWENADRLIANHYGKSKPTYGDPAGNFQIEVEGRHLVIVQTSPTGEEVRRYQGTKPLKLMREICLDNPAIAPAHAAYLGIELATASQGLRDGKSYVQDVGLLSMKGQPC
jgi:thymidylate synthase